VDDTTSSKVTTMLTLESLRN